MTSSLRGPTARAVGLATAIVAAAALLLGLAAGALGGDPAAADASAPPTAATGAGPAPPPAAPPATPVPADGEPVAAPAVVPPAAPSGAAQAPSPPTPGQYVVERGDTLAAIADRSGVPVELLARDSGLTDPDRLSVGQVLTVSTPPRNVVVIVSGATLTDYAQQTSTSVGDLLALNPQIRDPDVIRAGSGLRIAAG